MKEYLVQSHEECGKLYISSREPEIVKDDEIDKVDKVIYSWDDETREFIKPLIQHLIEEQICTQNDIENELELSGITDDDYTLVVRALINRISFDSSLNNTYIDLIRKNRTISKKEQKKMHSIIRILFHNQSMYVRNFDYSKIDFNKIKENRQRVRRLYIPEKK